MTWSPDQERAIRALTVWLTDDKGEQIQYLAGPAGSGKTSLIRELGIEAGALFAAPTAKAALVMKQKGCPSPSTLHSLLYVPVEGRDEDGKRVLRFVRREDSLVADAPLVVVDEASMVSGPLAAELLSYGRKVLAIGDPHQLPPVGEAGFFTSRKPDHYLETVHRQALDSGIIRLATDVRITGRYSRVPGFYGSDVCVVPLRMLDADEFADLDRTHDQIIVGTNNRRHAMNTLLRATRGFVSPLPEALDKIVCLRNDAMRGLQNGSLYSVVRTGTRGEGWINMTIRGDDPNVPALDVCAHDHHFLGREKVLEGLDWSERKKRQEFDFGLAVTAHKCVSGHTLVETPRGLERIDEIPEHGFIATSEGAREYRDKVTNPIGAMLRVTTKCGYTLDVTPEHGLFVWDQERGYIRREAQDVEIGQRTRMLLEPVVPVTDPVVLPADHDHHDVRSKIYRLPTHVTADVAEWLGLMVGDGTVWKSGLRLVKRHADVVARFEELSVTMFGAFGSHPTYKNAFAFEIMSRQIADWCHAIGGLSPHQKYIPKQIRQSSFGIQAKFLRGLFEDGTVNVKTDKLDHVEFSTEHEAMAREVQVMLLRFGIISARRVHKNQDLHMVYIYGANAHRYRDTIGFVSAFKNGRLLLSAGDETRYAVPYTDAEIDDVGRGLPQLDRQNLRQYKYLSRAKVRALGLDASRLRFHHDPIVSVERIDDAPSYCVTVPSAGSFLQNGQPQSNSQGSQWPGVVVVDESRVFRKDARKWLYTAATRASDRLVVVT